MQGFSAAKNKKKYRLTQSVSRGLIRDGGSLAFLFLLLHFGHLFFQGIVFEILLSLAIYGLADSQPMLQELGRDKRKSGGCSTKEKVTKKQVLFALVHTPAALFPRALLSPAQG